MALHPISPKPGSRETLYAIIGSFVISVILASLLTGSPFHSLVQAYRDYGSEPRGGTPAATPAPAATTPAPAAATPPAK